MIITIIIFFTLMILIIFRKKIISKIKDSKNKKTIREVEKDFIYTPVASSRTFEFSIQIDELGSGQVKINIVKPTKKDK